MQNERESRFRDLRNSSAPFSETEIARFWKTLGVPTVLTALALLVAHRTFGVTEFWRDAVLIGLLFALLAYKSVREYQGASAVVMVNLMAGLLIGLFAGALRFIENLSIYMAFNLLSEPIITMAAGGFIGWAVCTLATKFGRMNVSGIIPSPFRHHQKG